MSATVSDLLLHRLHAWRVRCICGYPGDGINRPMGAVNRIKGTLEFIRARHEETCAFMACAPAKPSREVDMCMATSGPGAIHLLQQAKAFAGSMLKGDSGARGMLRQSSRATWATSFLDSQDA